MMTEDPWDDLFDTTAARCCDCPSCNHYLPDGYRPESKCVLVAAVERIVAEQVRALADEWEEAYESGGNGRLGYHANEYGDVYAADIRARFPRAENGT